MHYDARNKKRRLQQSCQQDLERSSRDLSLSRGGVKRCSAHSHFSVTHVTDMPLWVSFSRRRRQGSGREWTIRARRRAKSRTYAARCRHGAAMACQARGFRGTFKKANNIRVVPLAGIEPALLAELDFEFGAPGCPDFPEVAGRCPKCLIWQAHCSIMLSRMIRKCRFGADTVPT